MHRAIVVPGLASPLVDRRACSAVSLRPAVRRADDPAIEPEPVRNALDRYLEARRYVGHVLDADGVGGHAVRQPMANSGENALARGQCGLLSAVHCTATVRALGPAGCRPGYFPVA